MTKRRNMTMRLGSKAIWFVFAAFMSCSVVQGRDHEMEIYTNTNQFNYNHTKGKEVNGFVFVKDNHSVQWSCRQSDPRCDQVRIAFSNGNPCGSSSLGPTATATCDQISVQNAVPCVKGGKNKLCFPYTTTVYYRGQVQNLTDDPEFIVDDSKLLILNLPTIGVFSVIELFALGAAFFVGYRRAKNQTLPPAPLAQK
jgi:hypothetical protein